MTERWRPLAARVYLVYCSHTVYAKMVVILYEWIKQVILERQVKLLQFTFNRVQL